MVCVAFTFMLRLLLFAFFVHTGIAVHTAPVITCYSSPLRSPLVSFFSLNYFPFVPLVTLFLVPNNHLPQSWINVAKGENHNLLISCKEGRKYRLLKCPCWVRPLWHTCVHRRWSNEPRMAWNAFFGHFGCQWKPLKWRSLTMLIVKCSLCLFLTRYHSPSHSASAPFLSPLFVSSLCAEDPGFGFYWHWDSCRGLPSVQFVNDDA